MGQTLKFVANTIYKMRSWEILGTGNSKSGKIEEDYFNKKKNVYSSN